jgi:hypothetical protein
MYIFTSWFSLNTLFFSVSRIIKARKRHGTERFKETVIRFKRLGLGSRDRAWVLGLCINTASS